MVISLIGYRACGKSSVAPRLAGRLGWSWVDCDRAIEQRAGVTVRQIFESSGEAEFRRLESEVLAELLRGSETVIATGGGAVLLPENCERLRAAGPVVWLHASAATLTKRLSREHAAAGRPSLTGRPVHVEVAEVLAVREPLYRQTATLTVHSDGESADQVARRIFRHLSDELPRDRSH